MRPTIIDYTLSRARNRQQGKEGRQENSAACVMYDPFRIPGIFTGRGKTAEEASQRQTYRDMQKHALAVQEKSHAEDPSRQNRKVDKWARFIPRTNVLWLAYLLSTLLARSEQAILRDSSLMSEQAQARIYETLERTLKTLKTSDGIAGKGMSQGTTVVVLQSASDVVAIAQKHGLLSGYDLEAIKESLERE
jgi:Haspin like kinase domain